VGSGTATASRREVQFVERRHLRFERELLQRCGEVEHIEARWKLAEFGREFDRAGHASHSPDGTRLRLVVTRSQAAQAVVRAARHVGAAAVAAGEGWPSRRGARAPNGRRGREAAGGNDLAPQPAECAQATG